MCVCVLINHVPGFTATQGHHFQPYHRSAGDSFLPDQQKVRASQGPRAVGGVLQRSVSPQSSPLCSSLTGVAFSHLQSLALELVHRISLSLKTLGCKICFEGSTPPPPQKQKITKGENNHLIFYKKPALGDQSGNRVSAQVSAKTVTQEMQKVS